MNWGFQRFSEKLYDEPVGVTSNATSAFAPAVKREVFYSVKDGDWYNPTTWKTVSGTVGILPTSIDDVYVKHNIFIHPAASVSSHIINNLFVSSVGRIYTTISSFGNFEILGNIQCKGILDFTIAGGNRIDMKLYGQDNYIKKEGLLAGVNSRIFYSASFKNQTILDLNYYNLVLEGGTTTKYLTTDLTIPGTLSVGGNIQRIVTCTLELGYYNLNIGGATTIGTCACLSKPNEGGYLLFHGRLTLNRNIVGAGNALEPLLRFTGNPEVELRGGLTFSTSNNQALYQTGTGTWKFTTNNQTIEGADSVGISGTLDCPFVIDGVTVTVKTNASEVELYLANTITAINGGFLINRSRIYLVTQLAAENFLSATTVDITTNANIIGFTGNYSATIPSWLTTFWHLTVSGTGTKTLSVNTTLNGNLLINSGDFEAASFNLSVYGTTTINNSLFTKNGAGSLLFVGKFIIQFSVAGSRGYNFSGNPTIEMRGGIEANNFLTGPRNFGTGTMSFTTNSQTLRNINSGSTISFQGPVSIVGNITLTVSSGSYYWDFLNDIDGTVLGSTLNVEGAVRFYFNELFMDSGSFVFSTTTSLIGFLFNGDYTIPYTLFNSLETGGTGVKTLSANTILNGYLGVGGILDCAGFDIDVAGNTSVTGYLRKTASGNILFRGLLITSGVSAQIDLSGNPNVELRGGFRFENYQSYFNSGTGNWTFTTNNQTATALYASSHLTYTCNLLVSGAITVIFNSSGQQATLTGIINGNDANSKFDIRGTFNYQNVAEPMLIGILETNAEANTFAYNRLGDQAVKGGAYRTMIFGGSGVKQLQGNVTNTSRSTTGTATLDLNGFTIIP